MGVMFDSFPLGIDYLLLTISKSKAHVQKLTYDVYY